MKIKFLGHASVQITLGKKTLLVDPFISANPLASEINIKTLIADYVLITHGHTDHMLDAEEIVKNTGAKLISNYEIISWFESKGLSGHAMNHGGKFDFGFGTVKYVNAIHSSVLPDGSYGGNPGGFVIWDNFFCIYIAGDTALSQDMAFIPKTCPKLNLAILPIGDNFTMGYEDALIACGLIGCDTVLGCHYDTFPPIKIDKNLAAAVFKKEGKILLLPEIGESINLSDL